MQMKYNDDVLINKKWNNKNTELLENLKRKVPNQMTKLKAETHQTNV